MSAVYRHVYKNDRTPSYYYQGERRLSRGNDGFALIIATVLRGISMVLLDRIRQKRVLGIGGTAQICSVFEHFLVHFRIFCIQSTYFARVISYGVIIAYWHIP